MSLIRNTLSLPFRMMTAGIRYRLCQIILTAAEKGAPDRALRELFGLEDYLTWCVNNAAVRLDDGVHAKHRLTRYHDFFVDRISGDERVIDIGCGKGEVAHAVADRTGATVLGIDLNREKIAFAKARFSHPNLTLIHGDVWKDLPEEPFDVVVFSNVLEHLDSRVEFLKTTQSRIRAGRWLIRVPAIDRDWRVPLRKELGIAYFSDATHFTEYTDASFREEMEAAEFDVDDVVLNWGEIWAEVKPRG